MMIKRKHLPTSIAIAVLLFFTACVPQAQRSSFNYTKCLENIPRRAKGLTIISGPRTKQNIITDMVPVICRGHLLFEHMNADGKEINPGSVTFRVVAEYTGEVSQVTVEETTIQSEEFLRRVSDLIRDTDFVFWGSDRTDTVFFYPMKFGH